MSRDREENRLPLLLQYATKRAWCLELGTLRRMLEVLDRHARGVRLTAEQIDEIRAEKRHAAAQKRSFGLVGDSAVIPISGLIVKYARLVNGASLPSGVAIETLSKQLTEALDDRNVKSIFLQIESPGGSVDGLADFADAVYAASRVKPVVAFADDLAASAAYYIGSQANLFLANQSAEVGSIGVYMVLVDSSGFYEREGFKANIVRSGPNKGVGTPGVAISRENLAVEQEIIDQFYEQFLSAVLRGRAESGLEREGLLEAADGRTFLAAAALDRGLIDGISTLSEALSAERPGVRSGDNESNSGPAADTGPVLEIERQEQTMTEAKRKRKRAEDTAGDETGTVQEVEPDQTAADGTTIDQTEQSEAIRAAVSAERERVGGIDAALNGLAGMEELRVAAISDGRSIEATKAAAFENLKASSGERLQEIEAKLAEAEKRLAAIAAEGCDGTAPEPPDAGEMEGAGSDPGTSEAFEARVKAEQDDGKTKAQAMVTAAREMPRSHAAWVEAAQE